MTVYGPDFFESLVAAAKAGPTIVITDRPESLRGLLYVLNSSKTNYTTLYADCSDDGPESTQYINAILSVVPVNVLVQPGTPMNNKAKILLSYFFGLARTYD